MYFSSLKSDGSRAEVFHFDEGQCIIRLSFVDYACDAAFKTFSLNSSSQRFSVFSTIFIVLCFTFGAIINSELTEKGFLFCFVFCIQSHVVPVPFVGKTVFSHWIVFVTLPQISWPYPCASISSDLSTCPFATTLSWFWEL